ncbi:MAG: hypothetical protein IPN71_07355 [Fibrobacteres bacterium]|nr:hypothetical protein [Fibrobacterota bacterium]
MVAGESDGLLVFARGDRGIVAINKTGEWAHSRHLDLGPALGHWRRSSTSTR